MSKPKIILSVLGARPQFVKAAPVSRALTSTDLFKEYIIHTGQHFDASMSDVFFNELSIPKPYQNLNIHSLGHSQMTGNMILGLEKECAQIKPDLILVYGDTNSTLAGSLVAAHLHIPLAHVEAGLRSFNMDMPEEVNRVVCDRLSTLLFAPTQTAVENLKHEGITKNVQNIGDVMVDAIYLFREAALKKKSSFKISLPNAPYILLTLHRQENTDHPNRLQNIFKGLAKSQTPIVFPMHPRTLNALEKNKIELPKNIHALCALGYLDMMHVLIGAHSVWTDSGGLQKESVILNKPCFTLRDETEWVETVNEGWNRLIPADSAAIAHAINTKTPEQPHPFPTQKYYGDGHSSEKLISILEKFFY